MCITVTDDRGVKWYRCPVCHHYVTRFSLLREGCRRCHEDQSDREPQMPEDGASHRGPKVMYHFITRS